MNDRSDISFHERTFGTTTIPCPPWCTLSAGHGYDSEDNTGVFRSHERESGWLKEPSIGSGDAEVSVYVALGNLEALRTTVQGMQVEEVDPPHIVLDTNDNNMSSEHAREVARMLLQAADKLDEVTAL